MIAASLLIYTFAGASVRHCANEKVETKFASSGCSVRRVKRTRHMFVGDLRSHYTPDLPDQISPIWVGMKGGKKYDEPGF